MTIYEEMNTKTKRLIEQTFLLLLAEKEFSKISVRDVTTAAVINRGTFYLHFTDKFELLEKIEGEVFIGLTKACLPLEPAEVLAEARSGRLSQFSMQVFHYIDEHAARFRVLLSAHNQSGFVKRLQRFFMDQFSSKYAEHALVDSDPVLPGNYLAAFAASAFLGVIEEWLSASERQSSAEVANYFVRIILVIQNFER